MYPRRTDARHGILLARCMSTAFFLHRSHKTLENKAKMRAFAVRFEDWPDDEKFPQEAKEAS
jgi:hypothetical protein